MFKKKSKSKKILDVEFPILASYPHIAGIQAVYGNNPYILPLIMSELIELTYDREIERLDFSVGLEIEQYINNYPLVYSHGMSRSFVEKKWSNATSFLKDMINDEYYVIMLVDTYYINAYRDTYGKQHYYHDILVYGYDDEKEVFLVADCFVNGKYEFATCTYDELESGFIHSYRDDWINGIRLFKLKEEPYIGIGYNTEYMAKACERYLNGATSNVSTYIEGRRRFDLRDRFVDGLQVYDELVKYVENESDEWSTYDIRLFYVLYDHAKLFRYLTKQLMQRNQIVNAPNLYKSFLDIENRIKNLYMLVLKYNVTGNEKVKLDIVEKISNIKCLENAAVEDFTKSINVTKEDIEIERKRLLCTDKIEADSIFIEYDDEAHWKKKSINDKLVYSDVSGAYVKTIFRGTGVGISLIKKEGFGKAEVYIDDEKKCIVDYSSDEGPFLLEIADLVADYHTLKLINISENGKQINFESFDVIASEDEMAASCRLLECKKGAGGNLIKEYGNAGYDIVGYRQKLPEYMTDVHYTVHNAITVLLMHKNADRRGVRIKKETDENIAAYLLSDTEFWLEMTLAGKSREVGFYCADYDNLGRKMEITVEDADNGQILYSQIVENFNEGIFLQFVLKGHVNIRFKRLEGPDAVLNAVWFE